MIPPGTSPEFVPVLSRICNAQCVDVLVPLVDEELVAAARLESSKLRVIAPRGEFIKTCLDKFVLMENLTRVGISCPVTRCASDGMNDFCYPFIVKPKSGRGSRGVKVLYSERDLDMYFNNTAYGSEELIFQTYIEGPEYTVSVVVWRDGVVRAVVPKEIIFKDGVTRLAVTRNVASITACCHDVQRHLRADGPFNVQLRIDPTSGTVYPFEINPRFSTTVSLTIAAGVDEVGGLVDLAMQPGCSSSFGSVEAGVVLVRRTQDEFMAEDRFRACDIRDEG